MRLSVSALLLAAAVILFVIAVLVDNPTDWWSIGLACFAAAFAVRELGWDRELGGSTTGTRTGP